MLVRQNNIHYLYIASFLNMATIHTVNIIIHITNIIFIGVRENHTYLPRQSTLYYIFKIFILNYAMQILISSFVMCLDSEVIDTSSSKFYACEHYSIIFLVL